ncbi:hypothetical protein [Ferruginibacter albus]|uniref:hypothetical protein n=1 Tax=Ferruginibacter albus TaxID=2875540 RepID=UPI001CC52357|nr:hypothetical protein [Ferruginibacter albus]UAY52861.1 hypothetical protein K9M53_04070 [Ferruginibacter albus]
MKTKFKPLSQFIADYRLNKFDNDIICFEAMIYFMSDMNSIQFPTEVQIITIGKTGIDIVYLLQNTTQTYKIPNTFIAGKEQISYTPDECLIIKGTNLRYGNYYLSIKPQKDCSEETINKINQRIKN